MASAAASAWVVLFVSIPGSVLSQQAVDGYYPSAGMQEMMQSPYGSPAFSPAPPADKWATISRPLVYMKYDLNLDNSGTYAEMTIHPESWLPPAPPYTSWPFPPPPPPAALIKPTFTNGTIGCEYMVDTSRRSETWCRQALKNSVLKMSRNPTQGRKAGSWSLWFWSNQNSDGTILYRENALHIYRTAAGVIKVQIGVQAGSFASVAGLEFTGAAVAKWNFITITWDGTAGKVQGYLNGHVKFDVTNSALQGAMNDDNTAVSTNTLTYPTIGAKSSGGSLSQKFTGYLDDFAIWPSALTASQIDAVFVCGVDTSNQGIPIRGAGTNMGLNNSLFVFHTGLTLSQDGFARCTTNRGNIANQGGWHRHITVNQADPNSVTQQSDWQGPYPLQFKGEHYLDNPYGKYRNIFPPHQGALHQLRSRKISVGGQNPWVATATDNSFKVTTGLNGEQPSWPYTTGVGGPDLSTASIYHSAGVHVKLIPNYLGWPGNGDVNHCQQASIGGLVEGGSLAPPSAVCATHSVIGLEHSDPEVGLLGTYGYTTWAGETQGLVADYKSYIGWPFHTPVQPNYVQKPVEGENGYMPTHTPHPTRQPEFYPTYGNHANGDSGELGLNEYPMASYTDCITMSTGSLGIGGAPCVVPGYKLANGLHPGSYLMANN